MRTLNFTTLTEPIPVAIQAIRRRMNLSQAEFAAKIGVKQNTLSKYERGRVKPSAPQVIKILGFAGTHYGEASAPLIDFLAGELGLRHNTVIMLMDAEQTDLLALMAAEREEISRMGAELKARRQALDEEQRQLKKEIERIRRTEFGRYLLADLPDSSGGGGERE